MINLDYNKKTRKLKISTEEMELFEDLRENFSVKNESAQMMRAKVGKARAKYIPDRKYAITPTGICAAGLYGEIEHWLIKEQVTGVTYTKDFNDYIDVGFDYELYEDYGEYKLRDYQRSFLERGIKAGRGICVLGTGGGKTLLCASLIDTFFQNCEDPSTFKTIIIVPNLGLVNQTYDDFKDYGVTFKMTKWTGGSPPDPGANVVICNAGIFVRRFDTEEFDWIKYVDIALIDEVHGLTDANKITEKVSKIYTTNKYGFTGTLPASDIFKWGIIGAIGPIIFEKSSKELRDEGYLTNAQVRRLEITYTSPIGTEHADGFTNELDFTYFNEYRNSVIKNVCVKYDKNILILVNHIRHGVHLEELLKDVGRPVHFIQGSVVVEERQKVIDMIESENGVIVIAISKIFSTGINTKNLHMLIFASGGKSFIRTVQSVGRGLRLHPSKVMFTIIDVCDMLHYAGEHAIKRMKYYDAERIFHKTITLEEHG